MDQHRQELVLEHSDSGSSAIHHFIETRSGTIALPSAAPTEPAFGASRSHQVWRMMNALIDAKPEWADQDTFEADRRMMLHYGLSTGMSLEELLRITDPDVILGLWTAAEAKGAKD
jgi:3-dehydroquinate synthetase